MVPRRGITTGFPSREVNSIDLVNGSKAIAVFLLDGDGQIAHEVYPPRLGAERPEHSEPSITEQMEEDLRLGEGDQVEFKTYVHERDTKEIEVVETVVAFSNSQGGRIYIGVEDNGTLSGASKFRAWCKDDRQRTPERLEKWFRKLINENVKPTPEYGVHVVDYLGETILVGTIKPGVRRPFSTKDNDIRIRSGATNRRPDPQTELPALLAREGESSRATGPGRASNSRW